MENELYCGYCRHYIKSICKLLGKEAAPYDDICAKFVAGHCLNEPTENITTPVADAVNHPSHYTDGGIETIDFIEAKKLPYHLGNAVKYISRAGKKDSDKTIEDINKAIWYLHRYIKYLEKHE